VPVCAKVWRHQVTRLANAPCEASRQPVHTNRKAGSNKITHRLDDDAGANWQSQNGLLMRRLDTEHSGGR